MIIEIWSFWVSFANGYLYRTIQNFINLLYPPQITNGEPIIGRALPSKDTLSELIQEHQSVVND